ncbi:MAG: PQQ-dependent sugar dehydrogenase [Ignavibacteria bacterium]|nr:PQQ-dependent sugar dehydrogenase [Ignavibacteria bacterium]
MFSKRLLIAFFIVFTCSSIQAQPFEFVNAFPNVSFSSPLYVTHANDGSNRVFVVEKTGLIKVLPNDSNTTDSRVFLDLTNKILNGSERGLLGLAFHPNYSANGYFYVDYTRAGDGATIVSRFSRSTNDPNKADSLSELILLTISQPYSNHNGGIVFFGLDGYLHIGMGDGGSGGDPGNRAQNVDELLGKVLRINVDSASGGNNYSIPATNPFAQGGGRPEIFTIGMRNPWRISVDATTGLIWCADVGQDAWEEVDLLEVGKNYGWRCYEGNATYNTSGCGPVANYTFPVKVYQNIGSECSVTGGYVYRGQRRPELTGQYIYADYCSRKVWRLKYEGGTVTGDSLIATAPSSVYSFGTDQNNELYLCASNNIVYRFNRSDLVNVSNGQSFVPDGFSLDQNYPNPFNPETRISYYVPELSKMKLTIYNSQGREVRTLVNTVQLAGKYNIVWNGKDAYGNNTASGAYFYNLTSDKGFSETRRMVLVK